MRICFVSREYPPETAHGGIGSQTYLKIDAFMELAGLSDRVLPPTDREGLVAGLRRLPRQVFPAEVAAGARQDNQRLASPARLGATA